MKYKKKIGSGGYGKYKSGYLGKLRDYMEPYRHPSKPPDDYDRRVRRELDRIDTSGFSGKFEPHQYRTETQRQHELSQKQIDELTQDILDKAIEEFKKIHEVEDVPEKAYEVMHDTAREIGGRYWLVNNDPEDKTTVVDFVSEMLPEKADVNQKEETGTFYDSTAELKDIAERAKDGYNITNDGMPTEAERAEQTPTASNLSTELYETQDYFGLPKKRATLDYESDYDAI